MPSKKGINIIAVRLVPMVMWMTQAAKCQAVAVVKFNY
jgi:hypothetical protein